VDCPNSPAHKTVMIAMNVGGEPLEMRSCGDCDLHWWLRQGRGLAVAQVLELAATSRR
jgi:hypothetical protein